ncbi:MAG TPA: queuosine precursor transporter [Arsenophonus nasoniae]|uniref:queuosine precursor transporter n=1 Tax=Arsenophonus nasoniae TaxID=638 RepID=UPI00387A4E1F
MIANEKFKLLGFIPRSNKAKIMILNSGRIISVKLNEMLHSEIMDDLNRNELSAFYRKLYQSKEYPLTQYDFEDRKQNLWLTYTVFCLLLTIFYVFSNIAAAKPVYIDVFGWIVTPGTFVYPFSFLIIDLLNEFFGFRLARKAIYMAVFSNIIIISLLYTSVSLPTLNNWSFNDSYNHFVIQIFTTLLASSVAFFTSEMINSWVLCKIKELTNTKYLFLRIFISTSVASLFDSFIFCFIAFYGKMQVNDILSMAILQVFIKLFYAFFNVFPAYGTRYLFRKYLVHS